MKDIKLTYNQSEIFALQELYERTILRDSPNDIEGKLLISILLNVYKKIRTKTIELKPKYTIKYTITEAIAFMLYFHLFSALGHPN